ncbi:hypothetical protein C8R46DRAFT_1322223 [Mycena filopes]|nr:hypothetical protein C8R46DRAFT_1322223 [Mycena filopes]
MDSPFSDRLHTNYVPSDTEVTLIQDDLVSHSKELDRLDALIRDLTAQRDRVQNYIAAHSALITPARRLPHDVVEAIFLACLPVGRYPVMSASQAPLLLLRICSAWRAIALSTPRLWASLHLVIDFTLHMESRTGTAALSEWLKRSAACPLSLTIFELPMTSTTVITRSLVSRSPESVSALLQTLTSTADRWRNLDLVYLPPNEWTRFSKPDTPMLAAFHLESEIPLPHLPSWRLFKGPHLRRISLQLPRLNQVALGVVRACDQLTHLSLRGKEGYFPPLSEAEVVEILKQCTRLISLRLHLRKHSVGRMQGPLLLPCLESLTFLQPTLGDPRSLVENLRMPNLRHFEIPQGRYYTDGSSTPFLAILATHSPLLESL